MRNETASGERRLLGGLRHRGRGEPAGAERCATPPPQPTAIDPPADEPTPPPHIDPGPGSPLYEERREGSLLLFLLSIARRQAGVLDAEEYEQFIAYGDAVNDGLLETEDFTWRLSDAGIARLERWGIDCTELRALAGTERDAAVAR